MATTDLFPGDLVFLTKDYEDFVYERNLRMTIPTEFRPAGLKLVNRIAKIEEIIDWDTPKGAKILELRNKSKKWVDLPIRDCKYIVSVYFHDLKGRKGEKGVAQRGQPMFSRHPTTGALFFEKIPDWIFKEIMKKCENFEIQDK